MAVRRRSDVTKAYKWEILDKNNVILDIALWKKMTNTLEETS